MIQKKGTIIGLFVLHLATSIALQNTNNGQAEIFMLDESRKNGKEKNDQKLIIVTRKSESGKDFECEIVTDTDRILKIVTSVPDIKLRKVSKHVFQSIIWHCTFAPSRKKRQYINNPYVPRVGTVNRGEVSSGISLTAGARLNVNGMSTSNGALNAARAISNTSTMTPRRPNTQESPVNFRVIQNRREATTSTLQDNRTPNINLRQQNGTRITTQTATAQTTTETTQNRTDETPGYDGWNIIFPGTRWCGAGARAAKYEELGYNADTDKCCRDHDFCNDTMAPGETKKNLTNTSTFTKLSCQCDDDFYECLDQVNSMISNKIGNIYFNLLRRDCYKADYPPTNNCKTHRTFLKITCTEFERNTEAKKIYQWVPPRLYKKLPIPGPLTINIPFA